MQVEIERPSSEVLIFLSDPLNLRLWTVHRNLYLMDDRCYEATSDGNATSFTEISTVISKTDSASSCNFKWAKDDQIKKQFSLSISSVGHDRSAVAFAIPESMESSKKERLTKLIELEFRLLKNTLESNPITVSRSEADFMQSYHLELT